MGKKSKASGPCVFCGRTRLLSDDHIPPKGIFAPPRPSNLITVRACAECNGSASKDDEYFRTTLALRRDTHDHPDIQVILPTVLRALTKPSKAGFRRSITDTLRRVGVRSPAGLYLGEAATYNVDLARLDRVVARTVRGLYFHETDTVLPPDAEVRAFAFDGMGALDPVSAQEAWEQLIRPVLANPAHVIGRRTFVYWFAFADDLPFTSAWVLLFYEAVVFLAVTLPAGAADLRSGRAPSA